MSKIEELPSRFELLKKMPKNAVCAEIGVLGGDFASQIYAVTSPKKLHLIDPWKHETDGAFSLADENFPQEDFDAMHRNISKSLGFRPQVEIHRGYSCDVLKDFDDDYFDWVYLDACHWYEEVKKDLLMLLRKVKPQGWICGHDYQIEPGHQGSGVMRAVNEIINDGFAKMVYIDSERWVSYGLKKCHYPIIRYV
jgi:hypothetical protein